MSATSCAPGSLSPRVRLAIELALAVFGLTMLFLMLTQHHNETIPYHLLYFTFAVVVGFRFWPLQFSILVLVALTLISTAVFVNAWRDDYIEAAELWELPLMTLLVLAGVVHAWRRDRAVQALQRLSEEKARNLENQREFLRDVAHAIRTPVTIAMGHLELLETTETNDLVREDHRVVRRQLERMSSLSSRLLALARLETGGNVHLVSLSTAELVLDVSRNWEANAQRLWVTDLHDDSTISADLSWLELALDALVENALKFTDTGDTIRLSCRRVGAVVYLEVADSGPGVPDNVGAAVFDRFWHRPPPNGRPGTGLGLSLVRAIAEAHGGAASVSRAPEGGAQFTLTLPANAPTSSNEQHAQVMAR